MGHTYQGDMINPSKKAKIFIPLLKISTRLSTI